MSNNIKTTLLIFTFVFSFLCSFAQTDETEKKPLATVLKNTETRFGIRFSYADISVKDKIIIPPSEDLSFNDTLSYLELNSGLDFKILNSRFVAITKPKDTNKKVEQLEAVFLNSYLTSGVEKTKTGEIILKPKKFGILPGLIEPDILQTIQALPGVLSIDESVSNLNVRGGTHDQNLILWDGIKMYQSGHFFGLISAFNPYLIKEVIVSKNGTSAIYGDGVSSTIDMRMDNTINAKSSFGAGVDLIQADAFAKLKLKDNLELQLAARRSFTDAIESPTYKQYFNRIFQNSDGDLTTSQTNQNSTSNEEFYFYDTSAKLLYDLSEKDKIRLNFTTIFNALDYLENATNVSISQSKNSNITQRNLASGLSYNRQWTKALSSNLQLHYSNYQLNATNFNIENNQKLTQKNEVTDNGITFKTLIDFNERFNWLIGYQYNKISVTNLEEISNPQFRSNIKDVVETHATFSEVNFSSENKNTHLKIGARSNFYTPFNILLVEPRLSINQRFWTYFKAEFLAEFKSQATSQVIDRQNDFLGIEKRRWALANNSTFPIIRSTQTSLGLHYNKNKLLVSAEFYTKKVEGITTRSQGFQNQFQNINAVGQYNVSGVEFLINKQFTNVSTWLSYSFSNNEYSFPTLNNEQTFSNNTDLVHAVTFAGTYTINNLKLALGLNWRSGKPTTIPDSTTPVFDNGINYSAPNSANLSDYFRTDFSTTYGFTLAKNTKAKVGISIWNVLNRRNILNTYYVLNPDDSISKIENESLGFTPNINFRVAF